MSLFMSVLQRISPAEAAQSRDLLGLVFRLLTLTQQDGRAALEAHASDWRASSIFREYPAVAENEDVRRFLVDALLILADDLGNDDLEELLASASRIAEAKRPLEGTAARQRRRLFRCVRRAVFAFRRGASPVTAIRAGRAALAPQQQPSTQAITKIRDEVVDVATPSDV